MTDITVKGTAVKTAGYLPEIGDTAPGFTLAKTDLSDITLNELKGGYVVLNIFPSIDTPVCSASVRRFNKEAANLENTVVLCVSLDLPFAHTRFCETEGIKNASLVSAYRSTDFLKGYGLTVDEGPLKGLLARSVVIINPNGNVIFSETVAELTDEPDYEEALRVLSEDAAITDDPVGAAVAAEKGGSQDGGKLNRCTYPSNAESSRLFNEDEPCDDGRAG